MAEQHRHNFEARSGIKDLIKCSDSSKYNCDTAEVTKPTSLSALILWNISKALEKNPNMEIKGAIKAAQTRLSCERVVNASMIGDSSEQRHLACAVLAWQQLGHRNADSLYEFIEKENRRDQGCSAALSNDSTSEEMSARSSQESKYSKDVHSMSFGSNSIGPVVKLPVETKIVMRLESSASARNTVKKPKAQNRGTMDKIDAACCLDSACVARLAAVDTATKELRTRTSMLAKREAERVELLDRAEAAWRDLELGYQKRLNLAQEKEDDLTKHIQKMVQERNEFKNICTALAAQLKEKGEKAEKDRAALSVVEKDVCTRACKRLKLSQEAEQTDALLAEHQCKVTQLDRDIQFKEEQARRKMLNIQSELESSQAITYETERAMRAELASLREQVAQLSEQLLKEDAQNAQIKAELEDLRQEKMGMIEDLEGCKETCDNNMQKKVDELKKKAGQLQELKNRVTECRCKVPVDVTVEAKRTPSLAALCQCTPEEKILESCSCTSLRSSLLSNLLEDLFSGLQSEMGGTGTAMPCQLLKCLEDKHNWDRASVIKSNLKNYFAQLLIGELDIAIATSLEKYHAKWVGKSCADTAKMIPDSDEAKNEGWQERAIEQRAKTLATKLAEQLFQERADQLTKKAKDIVSSGPPPCKCEPVKGTADNKADVGKEPEKVYQALVNPMSTAPVYGPITPANTPAYWRQTMQDVTKLRKQLEDLKKDAIKKADLKSMEEKITKIVQRGPVAGKAENRENTSFNFNAPNDTMVKKEQKVNRITNQSIYYVNNNKPNFPKKKLIESNCPRKGQKPNLIQNNCDKTVKPLKKLGQTYAINMCMCSQKDPRKLVQQNKVPTETTFEERPKDRSSKDIIPPLSNNVKQSKPINSGLQFQDISTRSNSKASEQQACQSDCVCFHKVPSNTSIDKLLETLIKWKSDLSPCDTIKECESKTPPCIFIPSCKLSELKNKNIIQTDNNKNSMHTSDTTQMESQESDIQNNTSIKSTISPESRGKDDFTNSCSPGILIASGNSNAKNNSITTDTGFIAPTESEYMGAINLEKSNEDFCKCINNSRKTSDPPNEPFQCMPCKCSCKSIATKKEKVQAGDGVDVPIDRQGEQKSSEFNKKLQNKSSDVKLQKSEIFPSGHGYDIKFLGVTLADVKSDNQTKCLCSDKETKLNGKCPTSDRESSRVYRANIIDTNINAENTNEEKTKKKITETKQEAISDRKTNMKKDTIIETGNKNFITIKQNKLFENKNKNTDNKIELCQIPSCNSKVKFNELKTYVDVAFKTQQTNEDKGFDVQSFRDNINKKESCVCCDTPNLDDSIDLEKNTFYLLEDHLKKKLEQFKDDSCNSTCIPPAEEDKLFNTILNRVKQVITDSTNDISCKCTSNEDNSKGSWNRAYGLLQEYLKTKIQRVQCSCVSEDNNHILPELLDKVCNLIEGDFKRLKDVCGCKKSELKLKMKEVGFKEKLPEKDTLNNDVLNNELKDEKGLDSRRFQNSLTPVIVKDNNLPQAPNFLGIETKSYNPLDKYQTSKTNKTLNKIRYDCKCDDKIDSELFDKNSIQVQKSESFRENTPYSNLSYVGYASECLCKNIECTNNTTSIVDSNKTAIVNYALKSHPNFNGVEKIKPIPCNKAIQIKVSKKSLPLQSEKTILIDKGQSCHITVESDADGGNNTIKTKQSSELGRNYRCNFTNWGLHSQINENFINVGSTNMVNDHLPDKPYIGYTIDCSCDTAFGACVCSKSISLAYNNNNNINSIIKKSMPNDKYHEKVSYIMKSNPKENHHTDLSSVMNEDLYLHNVLKHKLIEVYPKQDCETAVSLRDGEGVILKSSKEYFDMTNTTTNTIEDDFSLDTDYSNTEAPLDWCECCSQTHPHETDSDQLKHSIYFPAPLENLDNYIKSNFEKDNEKDNAKSIQEVLTECDCDMVPICHVKMLVENIENKLVSANCTCDSMKPKACPIHSLKH